MKENWKNIVHIKSPWILRCKDKLGKVDSTRGPHRRHGMLMWNTQVHKHNTSLCVLGRGGGEAYTRTTIEIKHNNSTRPTGSHTHTHIHTHYQQPPPPPPPSPPHPTPPPPLSRQLPRTSASRAMRVSMPKRTSLKYAARGSLSKLWAISSMRGRGCRTIRSFLAPLLLRNSVEMQ